MAKTLAEFKLTRWWLPTVRRYKAHVEVYKALGCEDLIEPFPRFVFEVLQAPEAVRDDMLAMPDPEPFTPPVRYRQYDAPTQAEQLMGSSRPRDKGRPR